MTSAAVADMPEPDNPDALLAISINLSQRALDELDTYRDRQFLTRPAIIEALILHLTQLEKAAPTVMKRILSTGSEIQHARNKSKQRARRRAR